MNPFDVILIEPILNILVAFYKVLSIIGIPWALGFSIILMTVTIRMLLWPLTGAQLRSAQKMAALKPHLDRIKTDHGHDKLRHQQEVSKLYKEHGVNPLAGCLPLILQIPVFIALYNALLRIVDLNKVEVLTEINNKLYFPFLHLEGLPSTDFLAFNLSAKPNQWQEVGAFILIIPILTGLFQFIQSKMLILPKSQQAKAPLKKDDKDDKKESLEDTMASMQSQMALIMPAMIAFFSYGFPVGLSLYWNTFTVLGVVQQYHVSGPGGLKQYLPQSWQKEKK